MGELKEPCRLRRIPDWRYRLMDYCTRRQRQIFEWGTFDCCTFFADAIKCVTGVDVLEGHRGKWNDEASAKRYLVETWGDMHSGLDAVLGDAVDIEDAEIGEIILMSDHRYTCAGLCLGKLTAFVDEGGVRYYRTADCARAWRW